jgi:hypothetical protein
MVRDLETREHEIAELQKRMIIDSNELNGLNNQISLIMEAGKYKERV